VIPRPIAILRGAHNPALAGKFVQFWFSRPVQEEIARQHLIPAIADIPLSDLRRQAELHPLPLDPVQAVQVQREVLKRFRYEIERN
jgi:ABC-type thiamine transport system substrate-binding protein